MLAARIPAAGRQGLAAPLRCWINQCHLWGRRPHPGATQPSKNGSVTNESYPSAHRCIPSQTGAYQHPESNVWDTSGTDELLGQQVPDTTCNAAQPMGDGHPLELSGADGIYRIITTSRK